SLIATPRAALQCSPKASWRHIEGNDALHDFDQIPLTSLDGSRIEGVFVRGQGRIALDTGMFMAADASLLSFVETADKQRFRFLVSDGEIAGLVTLSDLQKLPVYALLFGLVIAIEMLLTEWMRSACQATPDAWLKHLAPDQHKIVERYWTKAQRDNVAIDRLS